jgi:phage protein D
VAAEERRANRAAFRLIVDDVDISDKARPRLISLSLTEKRGEEADDLSLVLEDTDGKLELPRKGALIKLELGWEAGKDVKTGLVDKGRFTVDQVDWGGPPDAVTIRARSADLTAGFRKRKEKSHKETTLGAIANEVAKNQGLVAKVSPELASIAVPILTQHQKSDMQLLRQLGREHDAVATVKDRKLIFAPIGKGASVSGKALPALELTRKDVADFRYSETERSADAGVEARWHDQDTTERKTVKVGGGGSAKGEPRRLRKLYHTEAKAKEAAKAAASRAKREEASFEVTIALGRPDLVPEQPATLSGFKSAIDAKTWIITELSHTLDTSGLSTKLSLEVKS